MLLLGRTASSTPRVVSWHPCCKVGQGSGIMPKAQDCLADVKSALGCRFSPRAQHSTMYDQMLSGKTGNLRAQLQRISCGGQWCVARPWLVLWWYCQISWCVDVLERNTSAAPVPTLLSEPLHSTRTILCIGADSTECGDEWHVQECLQNGSSRNFRHLMTTRARAIGSPSHNTRDRATLPVSTSPYMHFTQSTWKSQDELQARRPLLSAKHAPGFFTAEGPKGRAKACCKMGISTCPGRCPPHCSISLRHLGSVWDEGLPQQLAGF